MNLPDPLPSTLTPIERLRLLLSATVWLEEQALTESAFARDMACRVARIVATAAKTAEQAREQAAALRRGDGPDGQNGLDTQEALATLAGIVRGLTETATAASQAMAHQANSMIDTVSNLRQNAEAMGRLAGQMLTLL